MALTLRAMATHDLDRVVLLAEAAKEAPHWARGDYEKVLQSAGSDSLIRHAVVAVSGTMVVGFAVAAWVPLEVAAEIEIVVVDLAYRRHGAGKALLQACMAWSVDVGATAVRLEVRASNAAALGLYACLGFVQKGVRRRYYGEPVEDAVVLSVSLVLGAEARSR